MCLFRAVKYDAQIYTNNKSELGARSEPRRVAAYGHGEPGAGASGTEDRVGSSESGSLSTTERSGPHHWPRDCDVNTLSPNGLHVLANDLQVPRPHVAEIGSGDEYLAGEAEGEGCLILESDGEEQRPVLNGMADVVYNPVVDFDIALAKVLAVFPDTLVSLPAFLVGDRGNGRAPDRKSVV